MTDSENQKFSFKTLFSEVFKCHSEDELEKHWAAGTLGNIPSINNVSTSLPQPWVFVRVFLGSLLVYFTFLYCWNKFNNANLLPGIIIIGSIIIPFSVLIFFFEMNSRRNVSIYLVMKLLVLGGAISLLFSLFMFKVAALLEMQWLGASVAGFAEEIGKILAIILVIRNRRYPYILNGILFGAAIGTGFAIFETMGYALRFLTLPIIEAAVANSEEIKKLVSENASAGIGTWDSLHTIFRTLAIKSGSAMFDVLTLRGLISPFGHIIWTANIAGGLWLVRNMKRFELPMIFDIKFVIIFFSSMLLHMLWNSPWQINIVCEHDKNILLGVIGWSITFYLIRQGLKQLAAEKAQCAAEAQTEEIAETMEVQAEYVQTLISATVVIANEKAAPEKGYDHLGIEEYKAASAVQEQNRERPDFSARSWQKYYKREDDK